MRFRETTMALAAGLLWAFCLPGGAVSAGPARMGRMADKGDVNIDLAVRQVTVTPIRAHVGDVIHIDVLIENKAEGTRTTSAEVRANGKVVGHRLFAWGTSPGDRLYRFSFDWDTRGAAPGEYRIRGEAFVWEDSSPFDNQLNVSQPVYLAPPGGTFPGGAAAGGSAMETDPRFGQKQSRRGG
jgi:hypothetical protein